MFADGDALLELIEKGDSIGFHMRGGYVHPSSVSLGVKSGGAVKRVDIDAFLASFRPKKGGDDEDSDTSESEDPEEVDDALEETDADPKEIDVKEIDAEETDADFKPSKLKKPAAKAIPVDEESEPDVKEVVDDSDDEIAVTEVVGGDESEQESIPKRVTFETQRDDNISDEE